jgi:hypothetical protein
VEVIGTQGVDRDQEHIAPGADARPQRRPAGVAGVASVAGVADVGDIAGVADVGDIAGVADVGDIAGIGDIAGAVGGLPRATPAAGAGEARTQEPPPRDPRQSAPRTAPLGDAGQRSTTV